MIPDLESDDGFTSLELLVGKLAHIFLGRFRPDNGTDETVALRLNVLASLCIRVRHVHDVLGIQCMR